MAARAAQERGERFREPSFLRQHALETATFYLTRAINDKGGYYHGIDDTGAVFDGETKHLVGTCRHIYDFSIAARLSSDPAPFDKVMRHGLAFLQAHHRQQHGGYAWVLRGAENAVEDGTLYCYGHAFVLLALSGAHKAGAVEAGAVSEVFGLLEKRFWDASAGLYVDEIAARDWAAVSEYRGQNANMHMVEALICAFEATGEARYLQRATLLARRLCVDLTKETGGRIWEHYRAPALGAAWEHDFAFNRDKRRDLFKPWGYNGGHFVEWSKLLLLIDRYAPDAWLLERAKALFDQAVGLTWDDKAGGFAYTFDPETDAVVDADRYYWVFCEAFGAAALLAVRTGDAAYWGWYDKVWRFCDAHLIDHANGGGWFRLLDASNTKYDALKSPPAKTDYHAISACSEVLQALQLAAGGEARED